MLKYLSSVNENKKWCCFVAFVISFVFMIVLYRVYHYAPFGNQSLAWMDANIQYLDFFAFLKDVIHGKNSIGYTLANTLGGTYYGVFSYYLASPLNLLIVFFEKEQLHSFFDLLVAIKLSLAAAAAAYYLQIRFRLPLYLVLCLSFSYAFGQYSFAQASNIMWLDGVYLLPVILAGVYKNITEQGSRLLSVSVALSVIFNWYSGGINCLFSIFYFVPEFFLLEEEKSFILFARRLFRYIVAMFIGLCISAFLFLPSVALLRDGVGKGFDWNRFSTGFDGNILSVIQYYTLGAASDKDHVALYCGSLPLLGCLLFNFDKVLDHKKRTVLKGLLAFAVLVFYWQPLFLLFSLLKDASSYWFRYAYIGIFSLLFIAAHYYETVKDGTTIETTSKPVVWFVLGLFFLNYNKPAVELKTIYFTAAFLFLVYFCIRKLTVKDSAKGVTVWLMIFLIAVTLTELGRNGKLLMERYRNENVDQFIRYEKNTQALIDKIKGHDPGYFRISQTSTRGTGPSGLTAHYNEPVAFHYPSISSYTSCPDNSQMRFLDRVGYRTEFERITVVNTSVIGADALLGVKYILSRYPIRGLAEVKRLSVPQYDKKAYVNKFALPMAFTFKKNQLQELNADSLNPFEYQNALYSQLIGKPVKLYKPVSFTRKQRENSMVYTLSVPSDDHVIYGNLPWNQNMEGEIFKDNKCITGYATWLSPSVFYIPVSNNEKKVRLELKTKDGLHIKEEQFYALDLRSLEEVSKKINARKVNNLSLKNENIKCVVNGSEDELLYLSVPYHKGWNIIRNGKIIKPDLFGNCLMLVPLENGENVIDMHYSIPLFKEGCIISVLGLAFLFLYGPSGKFPGYLKGKIVGRNFSVMK